MTRRTMRGFSLIEMMIVVSIILITSSIFFMSIQPALKQARLTNAYNSVLMTMRVPDWTCGGTITRAPFESFAGL